MYFTHFYSLLIIFFPLLFLKHIYIIIIVVVSSKTFVSSIQFVDYNKASKRFVFPMILLGLSLDPCCLWVRSCKIGKLGFSECRGSDPFLSTGGVNQDAKEAVKQTVETDGLIGALGEIDSHQVHDRSIEAWSQFARRISGEWDGFGADFSNQGKAMELPESVVPETYREWEVKVFDWQTQCPTLAEPEDHVLEYKSIQLLPTVGCEADAATIYSLDERKVGGENNGVTAFAYQPSGSYVAVRQKKDDLIELEYCLINPQDFESRVRIIQLIHVSNNTKTMLQGIRVFREQWYGPFRNGEQLGGCAIRDSAFASTAPTTASDVAGIWQGSKSVVTFGTTNTEIFRELLDAKVQNTTRDEDNNILLPKQLWCSLKQNKDGETLSEVGWLLDHGQAITSSCLFSSTAKLKEISIALETRASEYV